MKNFTFLLSAVLCLSSCGAIKSLETTAPFSLGEAYAQKWTVDENPDKEGYKLIVPIMSLSEEDAVLKNLYHKGKMASVEIKLWDTGTVAVAEFGAILKENVEKYPFELTETQAVISYMQNKRLRYYQINGIRQNTLVSYPDELAKTNQ